MIRILTIYILVTPLLAGCVSNGNKATPLKEVVRVANPPPPTPQRIIHPKTHSYIKRYNSHDCYSTRDTIQCKIKHAHTVLDTINSSLDGLNDTIGGCCGN